MNSMDDVQVAKGLVFEGQGVTYYTLALGLWQWISSKGIAMLQLCETKLVACSRYNLTLHEYSMRNFQGNNHC